MQYVDVSVGNRSYAITFALIRFVICCFIALTLMACSGGDNSDPNENASQLTSNSAVSSSVSESSNTASNTEMCKTLGLMREDIDQIQRYAQIGQVTNATKSLQSAKAHATQLRDDAQGQGASTATRQSAADLVHSLESLETTVRQVQQSGGSVIGVFQQLLIQLPAIVQSITSLRSSIGCP